MPVLDLTHASSLVPLGYDGSIVDHSGLWSVQDDQLSTTTKAKRADPLTWFITGVVVLAALNYATCQKPDPKWRDELACFASSCALGYSGLAAALRGLSRRGRKRTSNVHIESFNHTIGGLGTYATKPIKDAFNGELHQLLSFELNGLLYESYYQYIKDDDQHMARGRITSLNAKRQQDETGRDGGVTSDYIFNGVDVKEAHRIGNQHDDTNGSFEGSFLNSGVNDPAFANEEYFCANLKDNSGAYGDNAIQGAYFIGGPNGFPYQPGMSSAVVSGC